MLIAGAMHSKTRITLANKRSYKFHTTV